MTRSTQLLTSKLPDSKQGTNSSFIDDFKTLPFAASFGVSDPDEKLEILSSLIKECIDRHVPLKLTKDTRPPAPWLKDPAIAELKEQRDRLRSAARASNNNKETWEKFRAARNRLKELIKSTKRNFMERMLSSKKSKEMWKVIHRILHPSPQRITMQPDKLTISLHPRPNAPLASTPIMLMIAPQL